MTNTVLGSTTAKVVKSTPAAKPSKKSKAWRFHSIAAAEEAPTGYWVAMGAVIVTGSIVVVFAVIGEFFFFASL